jgi:hypothetical protein
MRGALSDGVLEMGKIILNVFFKKKGYINLVDDFKLIT